MLIRINGVAIVQGARMVPVHTDQWSVMVNCDGLAGCQTYQVALSWDEVRTLMKEFEAVHERPLT